MDLLKEYSEKQAAELYKALKVLDRTIVTDGKRDGQGFFKVIATNEAVDRDGEIIKVAGWDFKNFMKNPIMLWGHDFHGLPIGGVEKIEIVDGNVVVTGVFANTFFAQEVRQLFEDGFLRTVSVGFIPKQRDPEDPSIITEAELLEISFVPVPSNPEALTVRSLEKKMDNIKVEVFDAKWDPKRTEDRHRAFKMFDDMLKTVVANHAPEIAPREVEWDAGAAERRLREWASSDGSGDEDTIDFAKYSLGFAWFDGENAESFDAYKLPHQDIIDGEFMVVWLGVVQAMGALLGGEAGIPEAEIEGTYNHLAEHYRQFDQEPPELRSYTKEELEELFGEAEEAGVHDKPKPKPEKDVVPAKGSVESVEKAGRVLSKKNRQLVKSTIDALTSLYDASEVDPEKEKHLKSLQTLDKALEEVIVAAKKSL